MVIEMLTFAVTAAERDAWLRIEETVWSRFLERQEGFVRKQMWVDVDEPDLVHAVIWWESLAAWQAIGAERVAEVDARMGAWFREGTLRTFEVVRDR